MILVTLGTHPKPMDRLVRELDALIERRELTQDVVITAAAYGEQPGRARALGIQPYAVLERMAKAATVMVTHGGPASIALALSYGHVPVVVPRDPEFGEHVDDHQIQFSVWLAGHRDVSVVRNMADLGGAIARAVALRSEVPEIARVPAEAILRLRSLLALDGE